MPGKLREFFNNKMKELDERRKQLPEVDYLAVGSKYSDAFNFVTKLTELNNERNQLRGAILHLLSENATDEQLRALYGKIKKPNLDPPRAPLKEEKDAQIGENGGIPQAVS